uniref:Uncharacterized protein n=1 Tax=Zea mays TaxID=4577 RepID=A0A804PXM4_MAIZE
MDSCAAAEATRTATTKSRAEATRGAIRGVLRIFGVKGFCRAKLWRRRGVCLCCAGIRDGKGGLLGRGFYRPSHAAKWRIGGLEVDDASRNMPHSPRTKGIIQHFVRLVKTHTEGLDNALQVTNEKMGQLEATQIDTNTKLANVEMTGAHIDKSLVALLRRFDEMHANTNGGCDEGAEGNWDDYVVDTEQDDKEAPNRRRLHTNRRAAHDYVHDRPYTSTNSLAESTSTTAFLQQQTTCIFHKFSNQICPKTSM